MSSIDYIGKYITVQIYDWLREIMGGAHGNMGGRNNK